MQLGTATIPLLPAVAVGVAVVVAVLVSWGVHRARRDPVAAVVPARAAAEERAPCAEDWTGEAAGGAADPPPPVRRTTVADAVAARRAGTEPFPVAPAPAAREPAGPARAAGGAAAEPAHPSDDRPDDVVLRTVGDDDGPERVEPGPVPPPWSSARADPDVVRPDDAAPVSLAVRQALAAREMERAGGTRRGGTEPVGGSPSVPDARDRLLSVLLADPVTALGAATELDDTRERIERLGDVLRRRRADLATAVHRLHASGLTGEQIGRLSGLEQDDVHAILERHTEEGAGGG